MDCTDWFMTRSFYDGIYCNPYFSLGRSSCHGATQPARVLTQIWTPPKLKKEWWFNIILLLHLSKKSHRKYWQESSFRAPQLHKCCEKHLWRVLKTLFSLPLTRLCPNHLKILEVKSLSRIRSMENQNMKKIWGQICIPNAPRMEYLPTCTIKTASLLLYSWCVALNVPHGKRVRSLVYIQESLEPHLHEQIRHLVR